MKSVSMSVNVALAPAKVFAFYTDANLHSEIAGKKVTIDAKVGGKFVIGNKEFKGTNFLVVKNSYLVQSMKSANWKKEDLESVVTLTFVAKDTSTIVTINQINVPDASVESVKKFWKDLTDAWKAKVKALSAPKVEKPAATTKGKVADKKTAKAPAAKKAAPAKKAPAKKAAAKKIVKKTTEASPTAAPTSEPSAK